MFNSTYDLIWLVLGLPLVGFLVHALFGKAIIDLLGARLGKKMVGGLAVLPIATAFAIGIGLTYQLAQSPPEARNVTLRLFDWITIKSLSVPFEVLIDPLSMTMVLIITGVGALIHLYATGYMSEERDYARFFTYLNLFIAFMLVLVLGNNLGLLFIGWEGVGLCSYLLIGFWYKDIANAKAANKAFIVNRVGDWGMTLGMFLIVAVLAGNLDRLGVKDGRWLSYDVILPNAVNVLRDHPVAATIIALLLFIGACGKSAQFPLYLWLPDAMAGPTPVSALIHAATMVTAGVFMLNRLHVLFELSPLASAVIACVGAFTALFAALIAFGQTDIKKVLAYSTVSQLGFMFIACGAGVYWAGMFHVTTHAFFKALLFLGSGAVIHAMMHDQDMRNYGRLLKYLPITGAAMIVGWLAISGISIPYVFGLAGYYSKEAILGGALAGQHAVANGTNYGLVSGWVGLGVAALTAMYMTRMTYLTFFGKQERWRELPAHGLHETHPSHESQIVHARDAHENYGRDGHATADFFYSESEMALREQLENEDHHHHLNPDHTPREVSISMWFPLVVLALLSIFGGWYLERNELFKEWISPGASPVLGEVSIHPQGIQLVWLSFAAAAGGIFAGILIYGRGLSEREGWDLSKWNPFRRAARRQFYYDDAMVGAAVGGGGIFATGLWRWFDAAVVDGMVNGVGYLAAGVGGLFRKLQTGYVRGYALLMFAGALGFLGYFVWLISRTAVGQ